VSTESLLNLKNTQISLSPGEKQRYVHLSQDIHVLNGRFKLDRKRAIAFGVNARNYFHLKSKSFRFVDTLSNFNSFLRLNRPAPSLGGKFVNNSWAEIFLSYSHIIRKTNIDQLSAGITIKGTRGISGLYVDVNKMEFTETTQPNASSQFVVTDPNGKYGYSSNYDKLEDNNSGTDVNDFLKYTQGGLAIDVGVEYLLKYDYPPLYDDVEKLQYDWKIGISLLDLGKNRFKHGRFSRHFSGVRTDVSEQELENKFTSPDNMQDFYDSLETIVQTLQSPGAYFNISAPTRLVINVDRPIQENFFINGELTINFFSTQNDKHLHTRELNFLTITPRWETALLGAYIPIQLNTQGQLWIGTAVKAGPLVIGIHDLRWLFSNKKVFNSGGYLALIIRNFFSSGDREKRIKSMDCPKL
jgi:hypothetical protein